MKTVGVLLLCVLVALSESAPAAPPFSGTIFIDPDIITSGDPTTLVSVTSTGQGSRVMFDRRVNAFITVNAYLFNATFNDGLSTEIQVNPEFGSGAAAAAEADKYAPVIGRLPTVSRMNVQTVWIHKGLQGFGGGNHNLLIHTDQADQYAANGILEEAFVHESSHTSLDAPHATSPGWLAAQAADPEFISVYARDNPTREDIAESFLTWLALRHRAARITTAMATTITAAIPNRLAYFDSQNFNMYPISVIGQPALESWRQLYFGTTADAGNAADLFDFDHDGIVNGLEFAFGSNPTQFSSAASLPDMSVDAQRRLVIQFSRRKSATNPSVGYLVETGAALPALAPLSLAGASIVPLDATWERVTVTDPVITANRFGRVRVLEFSPYVNNFNAGLGAATLRGSAVWANQAVMLTDVVANQLGAVVFSGIPATPALNGFTVRFHAALGPTTTGTPGDGICFAAGDLGTGAWNVAGPGTANSLAVGFDTLSGGGNDAIGIHVWVNGVHVASTATNPYTNGVSTPVEISYNASTGVTVFFNGAAVFTNVVVPGLSFPAADGGFGISARTGNFNERAVVDNVVITSR